MEGKIDYLLYLIGPMMHAFATSEVIVLDGYCIYSRYSCTQKKNLKIMQMWHAMGAFKSSTLPVIGEKEGYSEDLAKAMNMHKKYDSIFCGGRSLLLRPAYNCDINKMTVMPSSGWILYAIATM